MSREIRLTRRWWVIADGSDSTHLYIKGTTRQPKVLGLPAALSEGLLKDVRTFRGDTQQDVADRLGMSRATISRWERSQKCEKPQTSSLMALEQLYLFTTLPSVPR